MYIIIIMLLNLKRFAKFLKMPGLSVILAPGLFEHVAEAETCCGTASERTVGVVVLYNVALRP